MAERELCDEQNEANHESMHSEVRKEGTAGYVDPDHMEEWHLPFKRAIEAVETFRGKR